MTHLILFFKFYKNIIMKNNYYTNIKIILFLLIKITNKNSSNKEKAEKILIINKKA